MSNKELHETLIVIGRTPDMFYRDTPQLLMMLDNFEMFNRRVKDIVRLPERRKK